MLASPPGNIRPNAEVQGVQVRAVGWPDLFWPELDVVVLQPLLSLFGSMARSAVLHEHVVGPQAIGMLNPRFNFGFEDLNVLIRVDPGPDREEVWRHPFAI